MIVNGVSMLFNGVQNIFNALYTAKMVKNVQDAFSEPIDVNDFKMK